jgi:hypothetical protein
LFIKKAERDIEMRYTDSLGFTKPDAVLGGQSGYAMIDEGELYEILYEKAKSNKWWILFFPNRGLSPIYREIEETYYKPKSGRNIGFELIPTFPDTVIVMCFKDWMNNKQLSKLLREFLPGTPDIPEGKDISIMTYQGEPETSLMTRQNLLMSFNDYFVKIENGE